MARGEVSILTLYKKMARYAQKVADPWSLVCRITFYEKQLEEKKHITRLIFAAFRLAAALNDHAKISCGYRR